MEHMTDREFDQTCAYLLHTYGLNMRSKRVLLECRLAHECEHLGLPSYGAYLNRIKSGIDKHASDRFVDLVTTHFSYFLRESSQFTFLTHTAFPELMQRKPHRSWRILCAGCSTGEECYTVSMVVEDFARLHSIPRVKITGIDVSSGALDVARKAVYQESHMSKVPMQWKAAYFRETDEGWHVVDKIRQRVTFHRMNLNNMVELPLSYDIILCRNVIIYFSDEAKQHVLKTLYDHLEPSGYLILGHAEIVHVSKLFAYRGDSIYQKQPGGRV